MDVPLRYLSPNADAFGMLLQQRSIAGFHVELMPPLDLRDRYLDTADAALLRQGLQLRLREHGAVVTAALRPVTGGDDLVQVRLEGAPPAREEAITLPPGPLAEAVERHVADAPLETLLTLRQYRAPRALYDGDRLAGVLSLDVVSTEETADGVTNEVEVELVGEGHPEDFQRLDEDLRAFGFTAERRSKFERALVRLSRPSEGPFLLLPDEREALEVLRSSESSVEQRRAAVILLAADGFATREISRDVSLSPSRVRHWVHAFRQERMEIFDAEEPEAESVAAAAEEEPPFRVSEVLPFLQASPREPFPDPEEHPSEDSGLESAPSVLQPEELFAAGAASDAAPASADDVLPDDAADGGSQPSTAEAVSEPVAPVPEAPDAAETGLVPAPMPGDPSFEVDSEVEPPEGPPASQRLDPNGFGRALPLQQAIAEALRHAAEQVQAALEAVDAHAEGAVGDAVEAVERLGTLEALFRPHLPDSAARLRHTTEHLLDDLDAVLRVEVAVARVRAEGAGQEPVARVPLLVAETVWGTQRRRALAALRESAAWTTLLQWTEALVQDVERQPEPRPPAPTRVTHLLASALWHRYERVRAYAPRIEADGFGETEGLYRACRALDHLLVLAGTVSTAPVGPARTTLGRVLDRLAAYRQARALAERLARFQAEWLPADERALDTAPLERLATVLDGERMRHERALHPLWEALLSTSFRQALGTVAAGI